MHAAPSAAGRAAAEGFARQGLLLERLGVAGRTLGLDRGGRPPETNETARNAV